jgi:hypothetical protein
MQGDITPNSKWCEPTVCKSKNYRNLLCQTKTEELKADGVRLE